MRQRFGFAGAATVHFQLAVVTVTLVLRASRVLLMSVSTSICDISPRTSASVAGGGEGGVEGG